MIFYVIFGDFVGWDWGTPAILQQKHPWKNWIKIWDWQTPTPLSWDKRPNFSTDLIWRLPWPFSCLYIWHPWWPHPPPTAPPSQPAPPPPSPWLSSPNPTAPRCWPPWRRRALPSLPATPAPSQWALLSPTLTLLLHHIVDLIDDPGCPPVDLLVHHHPHLICYIVDLFAN